MSTYTLTPAAPSTVLWVLRFPRTLDNPTLTVEIHPVIAWSHYPEDMDVVTFAPIPECPHGNPVWPDGKDDPYLVLTPAVPRLDEAAFRSAFNLSASVPVHFVLCLGLFGGPTIPTTISAAEDARLGLTSPKEPTA